MIVEFMVNNEQIVGDLAKYYDIPSQPAYEVPDKVRQSIYAQFDIDPQF